jgi:spermidine synthase
MTRTPAAATKASALNPASPMRAGLRQFLYITSAITGASILIVEILGAKMLSPYVGTSHFVWTAQIAVTLVSLAAGYYFGGWLVDRSPALHRLFFCISAAALYLGLSVLAVRNVAYAFLELNLALGALISSAILFFVPLTLLAATGPFLIRVLALSFSDIGGQVGRLSAISTLGSVLGTVLIGYILIPFLPNSVTMYLTAGALLVTCAIYFLIWRRRALALFAAISAGALIVGGAGVWRDTHRQWEQADQLWRANSNFGMLQVLETKDHQRRYYLNDFLVQNTLNPESGKSASLFTYMLRFLAQGYTTNLHDVLCIGMGAGIVPGELAREGKQVDIVEINPAVIDVARRFFNFEPEKTRITIGDGRYFLNTCRKQYDAVLLDAFLGDSSPSHLMTREAFENIRRVLKPGGVLVINSFGELKPGENFFAASLSRTLSTVFPSVRLHGTGNGNLFFAASATPDLKLRPVSTEDVFSGVRDDVNACLASSLSVDNSGGRIMTDDYNPVDFYDAANREKHRRMLALSLREL